MDVLSDAIAAMRSGRPYSALTEADGRWSRAFPDFAGARLHVVLVGAIKVVLPGREPVLLGPGDAVVLPRGAAHELVDAGVRTRLLCGAFQLEQARPHPLLAELPELLVQTARPGEHAPLQGIISVLGAELAEVRAGRDAVLPSLLEVLLVYLLRAWMDEHGDGRNWDAAMRIRWWARRCEPFTRIRRLRGQWRGWVRRRGCPGPRSRAGSPSWSDSRRWAT